MLNEQIAPKRRIEQIREQVAPYREIGEIRKRLIPLSHHIKWAVTLQTNLIPATTAKDRENQMISVSNGFVNFASRLNYKYYGKVSRRKPERYSLLLLPIVEGWLFSSHGERTLHIHVGVGNIPSGYKHSELRREIREAWLKIPVARDDTDMRPADSGFLDYIIKDLEKGCYEGFDLRSASIPHEVLPFRP